jgi:dienelactone hydrolase
VTPGLYLRLSGREIHPTFLGERLAVFPLRLPVRGLRLVCPAICPAERGLSGDTRRLGVAVIRLRLRWAEGERAVGLAELAAGEGFHPVEADAWCWTNGDAALPDSLFAGVQGAAVLLLEGFTPPGDPGPEPALNGPAIYLAGDSYPRDRYVEDNLFAALEPLFVGRTTRHAAMFAPGEALSPALPLAERLARLNRMLDSLPHPERAVLIGRSSGARVATLCARARPVAAVVCLGYPFRPQGAPPEPERFAHLAAIATPTLIVQGRSDAYGGASVATRYPLSLAVRLHLVDATHEFYLNDTGWAAVARQVTLFLAGPA